MKPYYILKNNLDDKIVGKDYPQVDCLTMHQAHLITSWHLFDPKPNLKFELKKRAILTDVLNDITIGGGTGFLITKKTKEILEKFNIMRHQYFKSLVIDKDNELEYYWLHLSEPDLTKSLDYKKTVFYRTEWTFREEPIELTSYEHYQDLKSKDKEASFGVEIDKIVLSESFDENLDLFTFLPFDNNVYISERLKVAIEERNVTGFKIEKAPHFI
ncbi:imm11 family protein [Flavobacterium sp.]